MERAKIRFEASGSFQGADPSWRNLNHLYDFPSTSPMLRDRLGEVVCESHILDTISTSSQRRRAFQYQSK